MNIQDVCLDEVALEGLDGITFASLLQRLGYRPEFKVGLETTFLKTVIFNYLTANKNIDVYMLHEDRKPLVLHDRYKYLDHRKVLIQEPDIVPEDIYPIAYPTDENAKGSCSTYHTRKKLTTEEIGDLNLAIVEKALSERIVFVGSEFVRFRAMAGVEANPCVKLSKQQYVMLERIGRSRCHGEVTVGKMGLTVMNQSAKDMHYLRKILLKYKLITKQKYVQWDSNQKRMLQGNLLHLTRFRVEQINNDLELLAQLCIYLAAKPLLKEAEKIIQEETGSGTALLKLLIERYNCANFVKSRKCSFKALYPEGSDRLDLINRTKDGVVYILELVDPENWELKLKAIAKKASSAGVEMEDSDDETDITKAFASQISSEGDMESRLEEGDDKQAETSGFVDRSMHCVRKPMMKQVLSFIGRAGEQGVYTKDIQTKLGFVHMDARQLLKNLQRANCIRSVMDDFGKQKITKYVHVKYFSPWYTNVKLTVKTDAEKDGGQEPLESAPQSTTKRFSLGDRDLIEYATFRKMTYKGFFKNITTPQRVLRVNFLLELIEKERAIEFAHLRRLLFALEKERLSITAAIPDRKTLRMLLKQMASDKLINYFQINLSHTDKLINLYVLTMIGVKSEDAVVQDLIETAKAKNFTICRPIVSKERSEQKSVLKFKDIYHRLDTATLAMGVLMPDGVQAKVFIPETERKCVRMKMLHCLSFYLAYAYEGDTTSTPDEQSQYDALTTPNVYHREMNWKRFIPPLPKHEKWEAGWVLMADFISRIPLSVFVGIIDLKVLPLELKEYLDHPEKRHYLLGHIPENLRATIFYRKANPVLHTMAYLYRLSCMGLMSFSKAQDKYQVFVYVHRKATLYDTTTSPPAYVYVSAAVDYEKVSYRMATMDDVEGYWVDLENIATNTKLGLQRTGSTNNMFEKKPSMAAIYKQKLPEEVVDDGRLPGDGRGAAGLDSCFFIHISRNWYVKEPNHHKKQLARVSQALKKRKEPAEPKSKVQRVKGGLRKAIPDFAEHLSNIKDNEHANLKRSADELGPPGSQTTRKRVHKEGGFKRTHQFNDAMDVQLVQSQEKLRLSWTSEEDQYIMKVKIASMLLDPESTRLYVDMIYLRDMIHERLLISRNKSSKSCQRRLQYMMRVLPECKSFVLQAVADAKSNPDILAVIPAEKILITKQDERAKLLRKVVAVLEKSALKFDDQAKPPAEQHFDEFPNSVDELKCDFTFKFYEDGKRMFEREPVDVASIHRSVVRTLILGSLNSLDSCGNWSYQLYHLYTQYPDDLLMEVYQKLLTDRMLTRTKRHIKPWLNLPFVLNQRYGFKLSSQFHPITFKMAAMADVKMREGEIELDEKVSGGNACSIVVRVASGCPVSVSITVPDVIVKLSDNFKDVPLVDDKSDSDSDANPVSEHDYCSSPEKAAKKSSVDPKTSSVEPESPKSSVDVNVQQQPKSYASQNSRTNLILLRRNMHLNQKAVGNNTRFQDNSFSIETSVLRVKFDEVENPVGQTKLELKTTVFSSYDRALNMEVLARGKPDEYVLRVKQVCGALVERRELGLMLAELQQAVGFQLDDLKLILNDLEAHCIVMRVGTSAVRYVESGHCDPWLLHTIRLLRQAPTIRLDWVEPSTLKANQEGLYTSPAELEALDSAAVPNETEANETEPTPAEPSTAEPRPSTSAQFGAKRPKRDEADSIDEGSIRKLKNKPRMTENQHRLSFSFVPRVWHKPDGSMNYVVVRKYLQVVASFLMEKPGCSRRFVIERFEPAIDAVHVNDLLATLEDLGCVRKLSLDFDWKVDLFGDGLTDCVQVGALSQTVPDVALDTECYYMPTPDCPVILGRLDSDLNPKSIVNRNAVVVTLGEDE